MRHLSLLAVLACCAVAATPAAQTQSAAPTTRSPTPIFRLSVSLVQLDAVVSDRKGNPVTTLNADDFLVLQDGKSQKVTAASYVDMGESWVDSSGLPPLPAEALRPTDARRIVAIVVDDSRMSMESVNAARIGLLKFADREFQPGDLAMLITTSGGYRRAPELTYSRFVLRSSIGRLRFSLDSVRPGSVFDPVSSLADFDGAYDSFQERNFSVSALERVAAAVELLRPLPGRKSVVLVSEGFSIFGYGMDTSIVRDAMQRLVDNSNRAGVVIYALDPRGLVVTGLTAADAASPRANGGASVPDRRLAALRDSQDGLRYMADETGGFAVVNSNDLSRGLGRIMADQRGYYLIGYQPEAGTLAADSSGRFRHVKIKVKQKGLHVRTRSGFYAVASE